MTLALSLSAEACEKYYKNACEYLQGSPLESLKYSIPYSLNLREVDANFCRQLSQFEPHLRASALSIEKSKVQEDISALEQVPKRFF